MDFLLVLIELFCWVLRLRRYERISIEIWKSAFLLEGGQFSLKFQVQRVVQPFFVSEN